MKNLLVSCVALGAMLVCSGAVLAEDPVVIDIQVSPNVINIQAPVPSVTVHADIKLSLVAVKDGVTLNGVSASSIFADDCGNLVAKFDAERDQSETRSWGSHTDAYGNYYQC